MLSGRAEGEAISVSDQPDTQRSDRLTTIVTGAIARPVYDRWRDARGVHIPDGCRVEQVLVAKEYGGLPHRLRKRAQVIGRSRSNRLYVRFDGEDRQVSIRPHLVRVITEQAFTEAIG
jgi:hypothetical protein